MSLLGRTSLALALGASIAFTACSQREAGGVPAQGTEAGRVVEVTGTVTATRGGSPRALATGDSVTGDDVVATGADGRVVIELRHNQVRWSLGPGREKKVADSAAWAAASATPETPITEERSGAAGRHAEREAADTTASAPAAAPAAQPAAAAPAAQPAAAAPPARLSLEEAAAAYDLDLESAREKPVQGKGARPRKGEADAPAGGGMETMRALRAPTAELTAEQIGEALAPRLAAMRACGREAKGQLELTFAVDAEGHVTGMTLLGPPELSKTRACLQRAVKPVRFPAGVADRTATYTLAF